MSDRPSAPLNPFAVVHMNLAREPGHPEGSAADSYVAVLPLTGEGRLDPAAWRAQPDTCRVQHTDEAGLAKAGRLRHDRQGWAFTFEGAEPDRAFRFGDQAFRAGEYVSIHRDGADHTYRIISLRPL